MAFEALIPLAIEGAKLAIGGSSANKSAKKAANFQRDYDGNTAKFFDVLNTNLTYEYPQLSQADKDALTQAAGQLAGQLEQNPYVFDGESLFNSKYSDYFANRVVSNVNVAIKTLIEGYLDQKNGVPATQNLSAAGSVLVPQGQQAGISIAPRGASPLIPAPKDEILNPAGPDYVLPAVGIVGVGLLIFFITQRR